MTNYKRVYFITCHQSSQRLKSLIRYLYNPSCLYIIHADQKSPSDLIELTDLLCETFQNIIKIRSRLISWGGYSQVQCLLDAINYAFDVGSEWSHLIFISEHHLPLHSESVIGQHLQHGISYIASKSFGLMDVHAQEDILYRFSMKFRELDGCGMFVEEVSHNDQWTREFVQQGSNWVILSRDHSFNILSILKINPAISEKFACCVQADELIIQTLAYSYDLGSDNLINRETVYVALPHRSGTNDLTFTEENFFDAIQEGYLFIRKTPNTVPPRVLSYLEKIAYWTDVNFHEIISMKSNITRKNTHNNRIDDISDRIKLHLKCNNIPFHDVKKTEYANTPEFYLQFRRDFLGDYIFVALLSENMRDFKILVCWQPTSSVPSKTITVENFQALLLKVRIHGLFYSREIIDISSMSKGFLVRDDVENLDFLQNQIQTYLGNAHKFRKTLDYFQFCSTDHK